MININDDQVTTDLIIDGLRRCGNIRPVIREIILEKELSQIVIEESLSDKIYNKIIDESLKKLPKLNEWLSPQILKKLDNISWNDAIKNLHKPNKTVDENN